MFTNGLDHALANQLVILRARITSDFIAPDKRAMLNTEYSWLMSLVQEIPTRGPMHFVEVQEVIREMERRVTSASLEYLLTRAARESLQRSLIRREAEFFQGRQIGRTQRVRAIIPLEKFARLLPPKGRDTFLDVVRERHLDARQWRAEGLSERAIQALQWWHMARTVVEHSVWGLKVFVEKALPFGEAIVRRLAGKD